MRTTIVALIIAACLPAGLLAQQGAASEEAAASSAAARRATVLAQLVSESSGDGSGDMLRQAEEIIEARNKLPFGWLPRMEIGEPGPEEIAARQLTQAGGPGAASSDFPRASEAARSYLNTVLGYVFDPDVETVDTYFGEPREALMLKVALPGMDVSSSPSAGWVGDIGWTALGFTGRIAIDVYGEHSGLPIRAVGPEVEFSREMILDWGLNGAEGRAFGHFTTRVLIARLPPMTIEGAEWRNALSNEALPAGW